MAAVDDIVAHLSAADQSAMQPETYANPAAKRVVDALMGLATLPKRAIDGAAAYQPGSGEIPDATIAPAVETAMTMMGGAGAMPAEANSLRMGIKAYHGSPADFDRFDVSKVGRGAGNSDYGRGMYFSESEGLAQGYKNELQQAGLPGKVYQVDIGAEPSSFLDINKPLKDQPHLVEKLAQAGVSPENMNLPPFARNLTLDQLSKLKHSSATGMDALGALPEMDATPKLLNAGIPGTTYIDPITRARNYVVFDDKLINIARKYGMGSVAALSPAALAAFSPAQEQQQ